MLDLIKNKIDNSVDRRHYYGDMNVSSTDSQNFSFDEKYTTAYTSPDQSLLPFYQQGQGLHQNHNDILCWI
jgi:hypothetical protein